jgi:hypothetical protein
MNGTSLTGAGAIAGCATPPSVFASPHAVMAIAATITDNNTYVFFTFFSLSDLLVT